jgi:superfamily I DNA/RNA helicase
MRASSVETSQRVRSVRRCSRPHRDEAGAQTGGQDRGNWYYMNLAIHIADYAKGAYEDFDGEPDVLVDAVNLTTIHEAKGLEWAAVFVPSLATSRFPSYRTGRPATGVPIPPRVHHSRRAGPPVPEASHRPPRRTTGCPASWRHPTIGSREATS